MDQVLDALYSKLQSTIFFGTIEDTLSTHKNDRYIMLICDSPIKDIHIHEII